MTVKARKRANTSPAKERPMARVLPLPKRRASIQAAIAASFDGTVLRVRFGEDDEADATLSKSVDPIVVQTAVARGETVIVQEAEQGLVVLGVLRTTATPGVDKGDEFVIEANRVKVVAAHDVSLISGTAQLAVRAVGMVETIATNITTRAAGVHKLIGRMLHLN
jgi:hypothetical protein